MGVSKVVYGTQTLIDLTEDTVTPDKLLSGVSAHNKAGDQITGTLVLNNFRSGTEEPDNSLGEDGDWYLVLEG